MKPEIYSKLVLLMVYLSECKQINYASSLDYLHDHPNLIDGNSSTSESIEFLYIVGVLVVYGPEQQVEYGQHACTGTMLRENIVLTLASCVIFDEKYDPDPKTVEILERPRGRIHKTQRIHIHPSYYSEDLRTKEESNFCLLVIKTSEQTVFPLIPATLEDFADIKQSCIMGGYGADNTLNVHDFVFYAMNETKVTLFEGRFCGGDTRFCLHFPEIIPCRSDYGTPLICNGVLFAVFSPRPMTRILGSVPTKCKELYLNVFLPIYHIRTWVTATLDDDSVYLLELLNEPWFILVLCVVVFAVMGGIYYSLVEFLQRYFDPAEGLETVNPFEDEDMEEYGDSWYDSQWDTRRSVR